MVGHSFWPWGWAGKERPAALLLERRSVPFLPCLLELEECAGAGAPPAGEAEKGERLRRTRG